MQCPKCKFDREDQTTECLKCGIVFEKYLRQQEALASIPIQVESPAEADDYTQEEAKQEFRYRLFAIPAALIAARIFVGWAPWLARILTMLVHESGHAVTAWLCGFWAMPGLWFTPVSDVRSVWVTLVVIGALGFVGFLFWNGERWLMVGAAAAVLVFQLICTLLPADRAQALIIFGGDGGSLVLGSILMATFYARRKSVIVQNELRWGFLGIGATAFMDAFKTWTGSEEDLPFGIQEGTLSDPSQMVETFHWTIQLMMQRYFRLSLVCLGGLAALYVCGLIGASKQSFSPREKVSRLST